MEQQNPPHPPVSCAQPTAVDAQTRAERAQRWIVGALQLILLVELGFVFYNALWLNAFLILTIMLVTLGPVIFARHMPVSIPAEFHLMTAIFVFAALFLGEIHSYYERIWWWDIALHASSGLLLGTVGLVLIYVLNQNEKVDIHLKPGFVALFVFLFALALGALWEIFEFAVDQLLGTQMQKPMLGDDSGLTDTMWDLIMDALGGLIIAILGWWYMRRPEQSLIGLGIRRFLERNPQLFDRSSESTDS